MGDSKDATPAATRHQQRIDDLCAAAIRALSDDDALHFRGRRLYRGAQAIPPFAPHLSPTPEVDDFGSFRGSADAMALRLRYSDAALHGSLRPAEAMPRMLFEMLEQFRVEALSPHDMPGMTHNLRYRFESWSMALHQSRLTETTKGILLYTVAQICRARVTSQPVVEATEGCIEATRMAISPSLGVALAGLRRTRGNQAAYARHALDIARTVTALLLDHDEKDESTETTADTVDDKSSLFNFWMDFDGEVDEGFSTTRAGRSRLLEGQNNAYRVFTRAYDTEVQAASLVRAASLQEFRKQLDQRIEKEGIQVARLARDLHAVLATPRRDGWHGGLEEGYLDGSRLSQLIVSPSERRLFREEQHAHVPDCEISFLIDCSGSMREHIEAVAVLVDVMVRALDHIEVTTEVLGFTTNAWNGGRVGRDWLRAGRPAQPGRLNEACHMVFKDGATSWRRARQSMAALLKADLFREGIDGEAVEWAAQRLVARCRGRRLLLVISDGSPTDGATVLANDAHYLDHHLSGMVERVQVQGEVEIYGVGVGADLSAYYRQCKALDLSASVDNEVFREIVAMIANGPRRGQSSA